MNIKETLTTLLPGVEISEEFVTRLTASIETAVITKVEEETKSIKEEYENYKKEMLEQSAQYKEMADSQIQEITDKANAYADYVVEEMTQQVDDYCEYIIEKFVEEQKEKLVETAEYSRMAKVLRTIKEAFETNYFQLSEEPANKNLEAKLEESKQAYNELFEDHRLLKHQISEYSNYVERENRKTVFESLTKNLADTQKERLERLIEKANFNTIEEYETGIKLMVEEIVKLSEEKQSAEIKEEKTDGPVKTKVLSEDNANRMKAYLERL